MRGKNTGQRVKDAFLNLVSIEVDYDVRISKLGLFNKHYFVNVLPFDFQCYVFKNDINCLHPKVTDCFP